MTTDPSETPRWLDRKENVQKIIRATLFICALVVFADLFYEKHGHFSFENIVGFHAIYGFISCVILVVAATGLRRFLMRDEDYYD